MTNPTDRSELVRMSFDYLKHLTTLSAGLVVAIATLTETIFDGPNQVQSAAQAIFPLGVTIGTGLIGMALLALSAHHKEWSDSTINLLAFAFVMSGLGFIGGLGLLSAPLFKTYF